MRAKILVRNCERNGLFGRNIRKCGNNIKTDLEEMGCKIAEWSQLAKDRINYTCCWDHGT